MIYKNQTMKLKLYIKKKRISIVSIVSVFLLIAFFTFNFSLTTIECKGQFVQPLNTGLHTSTVYDIANLFVRPIAATISVILSIGLAIILFFSVITSPFGYFFGIPSRKYVLGGLNTTSADSRFDSTNDLSINPKLQALEMQPRNIDFGNEADEIYLNNKYYPNFIQNIFRLFPKDEQIETDVACSSLLICYSHGAIKYLPISFLRFYHAFSKNLLEVSSEHKEAILIGLKQNHHRLCDSMYSNCQKSIMTLVIKTITSWLPQRARKKTKRFQF